MFLTFLFVNRIGVKRLIERKIKEECLRTYLFTYSHVYDSISLPRLATMYELEDAQVHSIVAKMIINQELMVRNMEQQNAFPISPHSSFWNREFFFFFG